MKKMINTSFIYAIAALAGGVFYREFTKIIGFSGKTALAFTHLHLFALGTLLFLLLALFCTTTDLAEQKRFRTFYILYNISLPFMTAMLLVRGIFQVLSTPLSSGADAAISGVSGVAHILMTVSLVLLFLALRKANARQKTGASAQ